jgi:hypothetical protein
MKPDPAKLLTEALERSPEERAALSASLLDSLEGPSTRMWGQPGRQRSLNQFGSWSLERSRRCRGLKLAA